MREVFYNDREIIAVGDEWISRLKAAAMSSPLRRSRLRLHRDNGDAVQEMIIALCHDVLFRPHRHLKKSESFHMIEGDLYVLIFNDEGRVRQTIHMGPPGSGRAWCYRLCVTAWHAILPQSECVVFHETINGPFDQNQPAEFAPWAPTALEPLKDFLLASLKEGLALGQQPWAAPN